MRENNEARQMKRRVVWWVAVVMSITISLGWLHHFQKIKDKLIMFESMQQQTAKVHLPEAVDATLKNNTNKVQSSAHVRVVAAAKHDNKNRTELLLLASRNVKDFLAIAKKNYTANRKVFFVPYEQFDYFDAFSASWLQKASDFLEMDLSKVQSCEEASFEAVSHRERLSMTLDWFDFSVEHLSKWWKMLYIFREGQEQVYETAMNRFDKYMAGAATYSMEDELSFRETVAVIAYRPYKDTKNTDANEFDQKAHDLTLKSLSVTIESLRRAGLGRVVVVGEDNEKENYQLVQETFRYLVQQLDPNDKVDSIVTKVGHMQVGYANYNLTVAKTIYMEKNVPRATLVGLRKALLIRQKETSQRTREEMDHLNIWLGEQYDSFKYVYLTEPDSVLQTRPSTLKQLKERVDKGMILVPHRFQPIPHQDDVGSFEKDYLFLPRVDFPVIDLDKEDDACCDSHLGPEHKPGPNMKDCGTFWYMCDFHNREPKSERTHERIKQYSLVRLKRGTEIVTLAGSEHGRPCIPKKNHVCLPPRPPSPKMTTDT